MIKINLANQIQAGGGQKIFGGQSLSLGNLNLDLLKELPIRKLLVPVLVWMVVYYSVESYKKQEVSRLEASIRKLNEDGKKLQDEINKYKDYSSIKKKHCIFFKKKIII